MHRCGTDVDDAPADANPSHPALRGQVDLTLVALPLGQAPQPPGMAVGVPHPEVRGGRSGETLERHADQVRVRPVRLHQAKVVEATDRDGIRRGIDEPHERVRRDHRVRLVVRRAHRAGHLSLGWLVADPAAHHERRRPRPFRQGPPRAPKPLRGTTVRWTA